MFIRTILNRVLGTETWPLLAAGVSAFMLASAHAFETFGHMAPCELCLRQREVYWMALALGLILLLVRKKPQIIRAGLVVLGLVFLTGMIIAGFHAGVEWKLWPGPASCTGGLQELSNMSGDLLSALETPSTVPQCDEIPWAMFGISMAGWNALASFVLAGISFKLAWPAGQKEVQL
jgi:disulfide bond formation protein DsbB